MSGGAALLVVDDDEANRFTLERRLRRDGYEDVTLAPNGREALRLLGGRRFDLVLLDIMMPEMNGYEVLERMKADMALRSIPVIVVSAVDQIESAIRCIELGAEDYLGKPFDPVLLRARVRASLERKRLLDQEAHYLDRVEAEKRRGDELLNAILPPAAVQELKATSRLQPRRYEEVAILFCDIVGFTPYCERHPPERVVSELQGLVAAFEEVAARHGLEKIKTVGDAFLATAGLLQPVADPVLAAVRAGLRMIEEAGARPPGWQVRVGIHPGSVVAGIIGTRQYLFDIWGDAVNMAARLAEAAEPNTVVLTAESWMKVRTTCRGRSRGLVSIKGKGQIELVECVEPAGGA
jgi:adenylate cyclase